jgi:hypothetical protein
VICFKNPDAVVKSDDDELRLVHDLFTNYSKEVRPVKEKKSAIVVHFGIAYTQLVELVSQSLQYTIIMFPAPS